jgi:hypothetical protein
LDRAENHDWDYSHSDDGEVFRAGDANRRLLESQSRNSTAHRELFVAFREHHRARDLKADGEPIVVPPLPMRPFELETA